MIYILIGFITALAVNLVAYFGFGATTFWEADWVNYASLLALVAGVVGAFLSEMRCTLCRALGERWRLFCSGSCNW